MAQWERICLLMQSMWVRSLSWEDPLEKEMALAAVSLPGKSQGQRSLVGYRPVGSQELHMTQ